MESSYLIGNIDFQFSFNLKGEEGIVYQATLKNENEEFRIYISPDELNSFEQICYRCKRWNDEIPYFKFGEYLQPKNIRIKGKDILLDLSKARLITSRSEVSSCGNIFYFIIDNYQYSYTHSKTDCKTTFFLNSPSNELVKEFNLINYDSNEEYHTQTYNLNTPNFNCLLTANLETHHHTAIIEYDNDLEETIKKNEVFLDVVSFYYAVPIEVYRTIIERPNETTIKHQQPHYNLQDSFYCNMDLAYLDLNLEKRKLTCFLDAVTIETGNSALYHTIINDYLRSLFLDETSKFLVLYAILETLAGGKSPKENFSDWENMERCFEDLYEPFRNKIHFTDDENKEIPVDLQKPNGKKQETIRWKWNKLKASLIERPITNSVRTFIENHNIDWNKMNKEIVTAAIPKMNHITKLRNDLVHDRNIDYTHNLPMKEINSKMSFVVCISLLNRLGMTKIEFHKSFPLLSIFKDA